LGKVIEGVISKKELRWRIRYRLTGSKLRRAPLWNKTTKLGEARVSSFTWRTWKQRIRTFSERLFQITLGSEKPHFSYIHLINLVLG